MHLLFYIFIYYLYNHDTGNSDYLAPNDEIISERKNGKDVKGSVRDLT
jgi:hypothetical protein